jgi:uncharacterized membrane protein YtjA (UPF0391 family)
MRVPEGCQPDVAVGNPIQQGAILRPDAASGAAPSRIGEPVPGPEVRPPIWTALPPPARVQEECAMTILKWALIFFLVSIVAGILGFTGISAASADVARFLFYIFVVIFLVLLILGLTIFRV